MDRSKRGGWITFPFIIATVAGLSLSGGWVVNLITCLKDEFHIKDIEASNIYNYVNGSITMFPILAAIVADSFVGCFTVIWFSSLISLLGIVVQVLTVAIDRLRPRTCSSGSTSCTYPSGAQLAFLYIGLALASLGTAGMRFTIGTMGANQLNNPKHREIFFNWYIFTMCMANIISATGIVYVEENVSWAWGLSLCAAANVLGLLLFLSGSRFYHFVEKQSSPFTSLACVIAACISKRRMTLSAKSVDYYHHDSHADGVNAVMKVPTDFCRFLNRAALRTTTPETTLEAGCSITNPWRQCTVEQVEDLKSLIKVLPIWSSGVIMSIPIAVQMSFIIFQAKTMDTHLGHHFKIPAASIQIFTLISTCVTVATLDRLLFPLWERKLHQKPPTPLKLVGIGHLFTILSMAISAIVESKRLKSNNMSVFWLAPQLAIVGISEAFHFSGTVNFYYREFPESLKSTSTAAAAMSIGCAFYSSNLVVDVIRRTTEWLPEDINNGRLDNVYWVCFTMGGLNFVYFLVWASLYKYRT